MTFLMALSIVTGLLCGLWAQYAPAIGLITWAGFAGCTSYFASNKHGSEGVFLTVRQNMAGVICGMAIIFLSVHFPFKGDQILYSGGITFVMCILGKFKYLSFIPGTFVGCFSTFAADGDWKKLVPSLIAGAILGLMCDKGGDIFFNLVKPKSEGEEK